MGSLSRQKQRNDQAGAAQDSNDSWRFDVNPSSRRARKSTCDSSHLQPPNPNPKDEIGLALISHPARGKCELCHSTRQIRSPALHHPHHKRPHTRARPPPLTPNGTHTLPTPILPPAAKG